MWREPLSSYLETPMVLPPCLLLLPNNILLFESIPYVERYSYADGSQARVFSLLSLEGSHWKILSVTQ